ncbi:hypothetical protein D9M72_278050 [compost metagenome]
MRVISTVALAAALMCGAAHAVQPNEFVTIGAGTSQDSCGDWLRGRAAAVGSADKIREHILMSWVQGFMSSFNVTQKAGDAIAMPSPETIGAWMDNACRRNPLTSVFVHTTVLSVELRTRAGK